MTSGVYAIVNKENGKRYIGSSYRIENRWSEHKRDLRLNRHHSPLLQNAWNKYGEDYFDFVVIQKCSPTNLVICEQFYLDEEIKPEYNSYPYASMVGMTEEEINKRHESQIGRPHPHKGDKGRIVSEETRAKMSFAHKGKKLKGGWHHTPDSKARISTASKGRGIGNKHGLGNKSNTGRKLSLEHRTNISNAIMGNMHNKNRHMLRDSLGRFIGDCDGQY
jgi:group I intron endonuclease